MKAIYYMYLLLLPVILFKKKFFKKIFKIKNTFIIFIFSICLFGNLTINYFNTGCFIYPAEKTCVGDFEWSIPIKEVNRMNTQRNGGQKLEVAQDIGQISSLVNMLKILFGLKLDTETFF